MKGTIFFAQECFVQSVVEIDQVVLEKKMKIWKLTDRWTYIQTDRRKLTGDRKSSLELSAKLSKNPKLQNAGTVDIRVNNKTVVEETVEKLKKKFQEKTGYSLNVDKSFY